MKNRIVIFTLIGILLIISTVFLLYKKNNKQIVLSFYTHDEESIDNIIIDFEKQNENITIEKIIIPAYENRLSLIKNSLIDTSTQVDIIDADIIWVYDLAANNLISPLDYYFSTDELGGFLKSAINGNIINNQLYGIPYRTDTGILYYRKDLLQKYNQKVPETFDELIKSYKIISKSEDIYGYAGSWKNYEGMSCNMQELLWTFGGNVNFDVNSIKNKQIVNTKENIEAFKKIKSLVDNGITHPDILDFYSGDLRKEFIKGNLLFMRDWPAGWNEISNNKLSIVKDKVGISYLPYGSINGKNSGVLGGWQLMMANKSKHKEESIKFIKFFTNYKNTKKIAIEKTYLPVIIDQYFDADIIEAMPFIKKNVELFGNSHHRAFIANYRYFSDIFIKNTTSYLKNEIELNEMLKTMENEFSELIN
ncbi:extracellular solute-binding protein [Clostridiaceae bacterium HSG29]|nr:extracellular solute-binding protein [Clostridiaceae bacterium HSG29]